MGDRRVYRTQAVRAMGTTRLWTPRGASGANGWRGESRTFAPDVGRPRIFKPCIYSWGWRGTPQRSSQAVFVRRNPPGWNSRGRTAGSSYAGWCECVSGRATRRSWRRVLAATSHRPLPALSASRRQPSPSSRPLSYLTK